MSFQRPSVATQRKKFVSVLMASFLRTGFAQTAKLAVKPALVVSTAPAAGLDWTLLALLASAHRAPSQLTARCVTLVASHANSGTTTDNSVFVARKIVTRAPQKLSVQPAIMAISSTQMDHAF